MDGCHLDVAFVAPHKTMIDSAAPQREWSTSQGFAKGTIPCEW